VYGLIKKVAKGRKFRSDKYSMAVVVDWFRQQPREFFEGDYTGWCANHMPTSTSMGLFFTVSTLSTATVPTLVSYEKAL
jgi:hypothetical protein